MMKNLTRYSFFTTTTMLAIVASAQASSAASFNFFQGGYSENAFVSGMFTGEDLDGDGLITSFDGEITAYRMEFSGNSLVSAFSHGLSEITFPPTGFVYVVGSDIGDFFGTDGILSFDPSGATNSFLYATSSATSILGGGPFSGGVVNDLGIGSLDATNQFVRVSQKSVPEPTATLTLLGLSGLGLMKKISQHPC